MSYNVATKTLTLAGTIGTCTGCVGTTNLGGITGNLETAVLTGLTYNTGSGSGFTTNTPNQTSVNVVFGTATSLSEIPILLTDLGLGVVTSSFNGGGIGESGTGTPSGGVYSFTTASSETMGVTITSVATPEPVSFLLLGTGLLGIGFGSRKRFV